jgi:uncharacterized protein YdeI (YjbR/CyaY-like superfamily)
MTSKIDAIYENLAIHSFKTKKDFWNWLSKNHSSSIGFWLRFYKKDSNFPTISNSDAIDVALCFGWIDGLIHSYDENSYLVRYTPRRSKSVWSKINVAKAEKLIKQGKMQPSGLVQVSAAKKDGRWQSAYSSKKIREHNV